MYDLNIISKNFLGFLLNVSGVIFSILVSILILIFDFDEPQWPITLFISDHPQITTTKLVALGLGNPSMSVHRNGERTRPGSLAQVIQG